MKKESFLFVAVFAAWVSGSASCAVAAQAAAPRLTVVATTFPHYDWTRRVLGDQTNRVQLVLLQRNGVDLHSYQPTVSDLRLISACDLFIYLGGESDKWVDAALAQGMNPGRRTLCLLQTLGDAAKEEQLVEGMEAEHDHDHKHEKHEEKDEKPELDEHVWLSLRFAARLCAAIARELSVVDPAGAETYHRNAEKYRAELAALDREYADAVAHAVRKTVLVADRFPFRYLMDDYGLSYFAAFAGCSAESEASFKTVVFLAKKVDELGLPVILTLEGTQHRIAETVRRTTKTRNQKILPIDSLQSVTEETAKYSSYLDVMRRNLDTLRVAIGSGM